jgi:hypothetical protein
VPNGKKIITCFRCQKKVSNSLPPFPMNCEICDGKGWVEIDWIDEAIQVDCPFCKGGKTHEGTEVCEVCNGKGKMKAYEAKCYAKRYGEVILLFVGVP